METAEDGKVMIEGNELKGAVLEGEEEEKYWNEFNESKANKQSRLEQSRGRGRPRGRGRGRGRGRSGGRGNDAVARRKVCCPRVGSPFFLLSISFFFFSFFFVHYE